MSAVDLVILGILKKGPMSPYDINKEINQYHSDKWLRVSAPAIYKNIRKLYENEYLTRIEERQGEMPVKKIYQLTELGNTYFLQLMNDVCSNYDKQLVDHSVFVVHLDKVAISTALEMVDKIHKQYQTIYDSIQTFYTTSETTLPMGVRSLIKQASMVYAALLEWCDWFKSEHS